MLHPHMRVRLSHGDGVPPLLRGHYGQVRTLFPDMGSGKTAQVDIYLLSVPISAHVRQDALYPIGPDAEARHHYFSETWYSAALDGADDESAFTRYFRATEQMFRAARKGGISSELMQYLQVCTMESQAQVLAHASMRGREIDDGEFAQCWEDLGQASLEASRIVAEYVEG